MWTSSIKIGIFYLFAAEVRLSSSTIVDSFSYCSLLVPSVITTVINATFSILEKSIHAFSTVISMPRHVYVNFNKFQDKIPTPCSLLPAPHSLLPAHILPFPVHVVEDIPSKLSVLLASLPH